ncbi:2-oxoglutarate and iron-dependent oxygenase domain-containing protein [Candidatus Woesearchaeota archaeon]|nr:2-oxoglutarate and iron-dependent oxygenase domain-containing protein [Candidatus Woesearchaeota archaeon]
MVLESMPTISLAELADTQPSLISLLRHAALDIGFFELDAKKADSLFPLRRRVEYLHHELLEEWKRFAALPLKVKMKYHDVEGGGERGYIPVGAEQSGFAGGRKASVFEWREQFAIGPFLVDHDPRADYSPLFYRRNIVGEHSERLFVSAMPCWKHLMSSTCMSMMHILAPLAFLKNFSATPWWVGTRFYGLTITLH